MHQGPILRWKRSKHVQNCVNEDYGDDDDDEDRNDHGYLQFVQQVQASEGAISQDSNAVVA